MPELPPLVVWLSIAHYCLKYDVDRKTVWKYVDAGLLSYWQVGRIIRVANLPPSASKDGPLHGR